MRTAMAIARREMRTYFNSPIAYIVIGVFLLVAGYLYFSTLFLMGRGSLRGFFSVAPVLFVVFAPAVTMRLVAEEKKSGTMELVLTMPIRNWELVTGKFLAALGMVCVGLLCTLAYPLSVSSLVAEGTTFDWGPVIGGYIGLILMASSFLAVGLWASALSKNQIVGFIVGLLLCFGFYFVDKVAILFPESLGGILEYLSVDYHFDNISRGVIDTRDLIFYASITLVGLMLTTTELADNEPAPALRSRNLVVMLVAGSAVLLNIINLRAFARMDLTKDHIYTLAGASRDSVKDLTDPVTVTAYFTEKLPAPYSANARYVRDLLEEYRAASAGKVRFEFIDPSATESDQDKEKKRDVKVDIFGRRFREPTTQEKELQETGVQPVEIRVIEEDQQQTKRAYMGLVLRHGEKRETIPVVQDVRTLEYDLTSLIRKMTRPKTPVLGVLQGHGEVDVNEKLQRFQTLLSQMYTVKPVTIGATGKIDDDVDALWVVGPAQPLSESDLKAVDQFIMSGKSVAFFSDVVKVDTKTFQPTDAASNLGNLLQSYGVTLGDQLVADAQSAQLNVQERRGFMVVSMPVPYPFVPILKRLEGESAMVAGLSDVTLPFVTPVTLALQEGQQGSVLANSSPKSWLEAKPYNIDPRRDWRSETITPSGPYPLMVEVHGKFKSHFAPAVGMSSPEAGLVAESTGEPRIIVAGGSALLLDDFMNRSNQALALNLADWLLLDPALLAMRTRGMLEAPLQTEIADNTRNLVKYGNALGLPLLLALYGLLRWRMREAKRPSLTLAAAAS